MSTDDNYFLKKRIKRNDRIVDIYEKTKTISRDDIYAILGDSADQAFYKDRFRCYKKELDVMIKDVKSSISELQKFADGVK